VAGGRVYLASAIGTGPGGGVLMALDAATGKVIWRFNTILPTAASAGGSSYGTGGAWETPLVGSDGSVTFGIGNPYQTAASAIAKPSPWLYSDSEVNLDAATGNILWEAPDPGQSTVFPGDHALALGPLAVANGVVYVPSMSGHMYALDAASGATLWSFQAPGSVNAAPAIVGGTLYWGTGYHHFPIKQPIGTASNTFYAFSLP